MSMRQTSNKFLPSFGRKNTNNDQDDFSPVSVPDGGGGGGGIKKLSAKLAHTTLIPALGNSETRLLQDLITAEKGVLQAHERLANETDRAAATLSTWAASEGPDLSDVFSASSVLLRHLSSAMQRFGEHEASIRGHYKSIRTKDEEFEELKKRRRAVGRNAETAERKLQKMGPENKNLPSQTELLERLREEMRQLDSEILTDEAKLGDLKRRLSKQAMAVKFGGLLELAEKMTIVGELGKLLIDEIPLEETPPGFGRAPYGGFEQCSRLVDEASRCISEVAFVAPEIHSVPSGAVHSQPAPVSMSQTENYGDYPSGSLYGERRGPQRQDSGLGNVGQVMFDAPGTPRANEHEHDYEWEQQREMDAAREREEALWREDVEASAIKAGVMPPPAVELGLPVAAHESPSRRYTEDEYKDGNASPRYSTIMDLPAGAGPGAGPGPGEESLARYTAARDASPPASPLAPPRQSYAYDASELSYARDSGDSREEDGRETFSTPMATPTLPLAVPVRAAAAPGKIPAGAFRRNGNGNGGGVAMSSSRDDDAVNNGRKLPVPPLGSGSLNAIERGKSHAAEDDGTFPDAAGGKNGNLPAYDPRDRSY